jgi:hypothetical protein
MLDRPHLGGTNFRLHRTRDPFESFPQYDDDRRLNSLPSQASQVASELIPFSLRHHAIPRTQRVTCSSSNITAGEAAPNFVMSRSLEMDRMSSHRA